MGELVMRFTGLCMHLGQDPGRPPLPAGVLHRVVAIHAPETITENFGTLPAHICTIESSGELLFEPQVDGCTLTLANASLVDNEFSIDLNVPNPPPGAELTAVPSLTTYDGSMDLRTDLYETGPPLPSQAACFVDIAYGSITTQMFAAGGIFTTWTVQTVGDPELILTPADGPPMSLIVPSGTVFFSNSTTDMSDKRFDFVLYYLAAVGGIPTVFAQPVPGSQEPAPIHGVVEDIGTTTSCSNSQYP